MPNNPIIQLGNGQGETSPKAPPIAGAYFCFAKPEKSLVLSSKLQASNCTISDLTLIEIKGAAETEAPLEIAQFRETFWLTFQLLGKSTYDQPNENTLDFMHYRGCINTDGPLNLHIDCGKCWLLLIGICGKTLVELKQEYACSQDKDCISGICENKISLPIGYQQKRILDSIQQIEGGAYSMPIKLAYQVSRLLELFNKELSLHKDRREPHEVSLYHQAINCIQTHYMDPDLDRYRIADQLHISLRTLNRLFESRNTKVSSAIQIARLFKARELLRTSSLSVEEIAFRCHFADGKHFYKAYTLLFKCKPTDERKKEKDD